MARLWICLVNFSQGFKKASGSKYTRAQNMARLWICEGYVGCWICLNEPEYALIMSQYTWMCLNNAEYEWIYRHIREKIRTLNMSEFWMCLMRKVTVQITEQLSRQTYSEHCQTFNLERFAKRIMSECWCATRNFSGEREGLWNWGTSINIS